MTCTRSLLLHFTKAERNSMAKELTLFSVFHKEFPIPTSDFIQPIQVGKLFSEIDLGFISDDTGDNIAAKNKTFSELTALYWIWKNLDKIDSKYIGLCHYRRNFILPETIKIKNFYGTRNKTNTQPIYIEAVHPNSLHKVSDIPLKEAILSELTKGKVVVPAPLPLYIDQAYSCSIKAHYIYFHIREDWHLLEEAIKKIHPEYSEAADSIFQNTKKIYPYNMFIGNKEFIHQYCAWLFPILFELETKVKLSEYPYQRRVFGFFSERLLNLYLLKNEHRLAEFPVLFFED